VIKNIANPSNLVLVILPVHTTYEDGMECSETSAHKIQALGNHPKERIQHSQHGESLKLRILRVMCMGVKYRLPPPPPHKRIQIDGSVTRELKEEYLELRETK